MREILFRGKRKDNGEWVYGFYYTEADTTFILLHRKSLKTPSMPYSKQFICVIPETVGQYTGLNDRDGMKIFEGDVIKWKRYSGEDVKGVVKYINDGLFVKPQGEMYYIASRISVVYRTGDVLGNIYDTPELLGRE